MMQRHRKKGFTLIEFVISIMISSILLTAVFTIYNQIGRSINIIETITTDDTKIMIIKDRLQQDINGLSPLWFTKEEYEKIKNKDKATEPQAKQEQHDESIKAKNFFYAESKNEQFYFFTFTTTNAMQLYGNDNKRFVRVVYMLKQKQNDENSFKLMRKEINNISDFDKKEILEKGSFYTIADDIKKCHFSYGFIDQPKPKQDKNSANDKKQEELPDKPAEIKWPSEWGVVPEKTKRNGYQPTLPEFVRLKITFNQKRDNDEKNHEIYFTMPMQGSVTINSFAQKRHQEKQAAKDTQQKNAKQAQGKATTSSQPKAINQPQDKRSIPTPKATGKGG